VQFIYSIAGSVVLMLFVPTLASAQSVPQPVVLPAPAAAALTVVVPRHTIIPVVIDKDLRVGGAGDAKQTKTVKGSVAQDIIINGMLIAKAGDLAEGHLTTEKNITKRYFSTDVSQEAALASSDARNAAAAAISLGCPTRPIGTAARICSNGSFASIAPSRSTRRGPSSPAWMPAPTNACAVTSRQSQRAPAPQAMVAAASLPRRPPSSPAPMRSATKRARATMS